MPNHTGPQIQLKDKRNPRVVRATNEFADLGDAITRASDRLERIAGQSGSAPAQDVVDRLEDDLVLKEGLLIDFAKRRPTQFELRKQDNGNTEYKNKFGYHSINSYGILSKPKGSHYAYGDYTGAPRAPHPTVFRKFGGNTRETVYPFERCGTKLTGLLDNKYDPKILHHPDSERAAAHLFPRTATPIQAGCPEVLRGVEQLNQQNGSRHWLFS